MSEELLTCFWPLLDCGQSLTHEWVVSLKKGQKLVRGSSVHIFTHLQAALIPGKPSEELKYLGVINLIRLLVS